VSDGAWTLVPTSQIGQGSTVRFSHVTGEQLSSGRKSWAVKDLTVGLQMPLQGVRLAEPEER